jgi:hypothetical protein
VVSNEGVSFPEHAGWQRTDFCAPVRFLTGGWLTEVVRVGCGGPPGGDTDVYTNALDSFAGSRTFFFEWRLFADGDASEIIGVAPAALATGDLLGVNYHFTIARDRVRFVRDNQLPVVYADIDCESAHTYRLELCGANWYDWYVDGVLIDSGVPEGPYPTETGVVQWAASSWYADNTVQWDYVRLGNLPLDGSGDYDSDGAMTEFDYYFFNDCLAKDGPGIFGGPGNDAGPGCRFTDFDGDADADLLDFAEFANHYTGFLP